MDVADNEARYKILNGDVFYDGYYDINFICKICISSDFFSVEFLDFVKPYSALIPEISKPNSKVSSCLKFSIKLNLLFEFIILLILFISCVLYSRT